MKCSICSYVSQNYSSDSEEPNCPRCGAPNYSLRFARKSFVRVHMVSGREVRFNKIKLYDRALINHLEAFQNQANSNFSGFSTGLGFWGDIQSVAIASIANAIVEASVSAQMAKAGESQLDQMDQLAEQLRNSSDFIEVRSIGNIEYPDPKGWTATKPRERGEQSRELIHLPTNIVCIQEDEKESILFWDRIEQYELINKQ